MATTDELKAVRRAADLSADDATYTDGLLGVLVDGSSVNGALLTVWRERAGAYAALVNVAEDGSSRAAGEKHAHALKMVELYERLRREELTPASSTGVVFNRAQRV